MWCHLCAVVSDRQPPVTPCQPGLTAPDYSNTFDKWWFSFVFLMQPLKGLPCVEDIELPEGSGSDWLVSWVMSNSLWVRLHILFTHRHTHTHSVWHTNTPIPDWHTQAALHLMHRGCIQKSIRKPTREHDFTHLNLTMSSATSLPSAESLLGICPHWRTRPLTCFIRTR